MQVPRPLDRRSRFRVLPRVARHRAGPTCPAHQLARTGWLRNQRPGTGEVPDGLHRAEDEGMIWGNHSGAEKRAGNLEIHQVSARTHVLSLKPRLGSRPVQPTLAASLRPSQSQNPLPRGSMDMPRAATRENRGGLRYRPAHALPPQHARFLAVAQNRTANCAGGSSASSTAAATRANRLW